MTTSFDALFDRLKTQAQRQFDGRSSDDDDLSVHDLYEGRLLVVVEREAEGWHVSLSTRNGPPDAQDVARVREAFFGPLTEVSVEAGVTNSSVVHLRGIDGRKPPSDAATLPDPLGVREGSIVTRVAVFTRGKVDLDVQAMASLVSRALDDVEKPLTFSMMPTCGSWPAEVSLDRAIGAIRAQLLEEHADADFVHTVPMTLEAAGRPTIEVAVCFLVRLRTTAAESEPTSRTLPILCAILVVLLSIFLLSRFS